MDREKIRGAVHARPPRSLNMVFVGMLTNWMLSIQIVSMPTNSMTSLPSLFERPRLEQHGK
jgi:hypothetical protein